MTNADIGALIASRICHDLISPVGAMGNGVELLREVDPDLGEELALIGDSAAMASDRLQFYRLGFGAAGLLERYPLARCRRIAEGFFARERVELAWIEGDGEVSRARARLICTLLMAAAAALPRGGRVTVEARMAGGDPGGDLLLVAKGTRLLFPERALTLLATGRADDPLGVREVHLFVAHDQAAALGARIDVEVRRDRLEIRSTPKESARA